MARVVLRQGRPRRVGGGGRGYLVLGAIELRAGYQNTSFAATRYRLLPFERFWSLWAGEDDADAIAELMLVRCIALLSTSIVSTSSAACLCHPCGLRLWLALLKFV